eukprot:TRINITY_DN2432_c0_g1_i4.p1 TRINITY_DN2432_c0_g1~~TRINITY_DN2432_c0_g1_i4.p1  ORF type:complete len:129 (-),score=31.96 TRINITY_DN2432_c0_g1_i4:96-482(-)
MLRSLVGSEMCIRDSINAEYMGKRGKFEVKKMVCDKCKKKNEKLITPEVWKEESKTSAGGPMKRKVGVNMLLEKKKFQFDPYGDKCKGCKVKVQKDSMYCQTCAYSKGLCSMCGVKVLNTKFYRQSLD